MLPEYELKNFLSLKGLSRADRLLLCLYVNPDKPETTAAIKSVASANGLRAVKDWNIASIFSRVGELVVKTEEGWRLTRKGKERLISISGVGSGAPEKMSMSLRAHANNLPDGVAKEFVFEAVNCFEHRLYRAAVVLSWIGAVAVLYEHVVSKRLADFNAEALRRNPKHKAALAADDLARMKESDFLDVLESISIIGKSVKMELKGCLDLRNGCGHPNSLKVSENRVAGHIELLIDHVFATFNREQGHPR